MGILIREARVLVASLLISAALVATFMAVATGDPSASSDVVHLGSGPRPIYRIGYSGDGSVGIDELIEQAQISAAKGASESTSSVPPSDLASSQPPSSLEAPEFDPQSEVSDSSSPQLASDGRSGPSSSSSSYAAASIGDEKPPYVRVPVVSDPAGAEVYIDGIYSGVTPFIATVEPESHLVEAYCEGYWNWFNILEFTPTTGTIPITLTPRGPASNGTEEVGAAKNVSALDAAIPPAGKNDSPEFRPQLPDEGDFLEANYRKLLIVVALLSFLIGSGSIASWARSRLTTSIRISFPRDGEDRWAGLVEGQASRIRGSRRRVYVLVRYDDEHLQVRGKVEPNRDGRWSTRCDVEEGTVYRIYAVVVDRPLTEGAYLEEVPSHRAISEVGPVTGRGKPQKSLDGKTPSSDLDPG